MLVVCDTLRADHLGCYGAALPTSPWLDRLAQQGVRFREALSPHIPTHPAHASLFSGQDVFAHRVVAHMGSASPPAALPWLPEVLAGAGVFTAAADNLGQWLSRGMQVYATYTLAPSPDGYWRKAEPVLEAVSSLLPALRRAAASGQHTFTFVHFWEPHTPYSPPPPFHRMFYDGNERRPDLHGLDALWSFVPFLDYFRGWMPGVTDPAFPRAQYAASVRALDHALQRLCLLLGAAHLLEDAVLLVTADHGEALGEHGIWFDHHGLYEHNLRVPLILWGPGRIPSGLSVDPPATLLDLFPTICALLRVPVPAGLPGRDLRSAWQGGMDPPPALYCTECTWMKKRAWRQGRYKLIEALEPDFHGGPGLELYDLATDPAESCNLALVRADLAADLLGQMEAFCTRRQQQTQQGDPLREQAVSLRRVQPLPPLPGAGGGTAPDAAPAGRQPAVSEEERARVSQRLARLGY